MPPAAPAVPPPPARPQAPPTGTPYWPPPPDPYAPRPDRARTAGARVGGALCLVLGIGLIGGAVAGAVINHGPRPAPPVVEGTVAAFGIARQVWHSAPVDDLFPPTLTQEAAGPGEADRSWTRIGVAAPAQCADAFDPLLARVLEPAGCVKLLRATYVDSTSSTVTTVGLLVTSADPAAMRALDRRWTDESLGERADLLPKPVAFPGTAAAGFRDRQRGSWDVHVSTDLPFVVYAVSGFADGRPVPAPQPAADATAPTATTAPAEAGLGFDAAGLAGALDDRLRAAVATLLHPPSPTPTGTHR